MVIEVFNRHENKFLLDKTTYQKITGKLLDYMEPDEYNKQQRFYTISNIYYDTPDDYLIRNSLAKPKYKEKLRLRAYGVPQADGKVYLEIKKKVNGVVNKRRTALKLEEAYTFVSTGQKPEFKDYMNSQVINEIAYFLKIYAIVPKVYLAYDRKALFCRDNRDLRITFDTNIRTRRSDLKLESGDYGANLLESDQWLMEVKAERGIPMWLSKLLSEYKVYKTSFSKYGTEYQRMLVKNQQERGRVGICLRLYSTQQLRLIPQYL